MLVARFEGAAVVVGDVGVDGGAAAVVVVVGAVAVDVGTAAVDGGAAAVDERISNARYRSLPDEF